MSDYTKEIFDKVIQDSGLSKEKDPETYAYVVDYLEGLGENFGDKNSDFHKNITEALTNYASVSVRQRKKMGTLSVLKESLESATKALEAAKVKYDEEYAKTGIFFNRNPIEYQQATKEKNETEERVAQIKKKIEANSLQEDEFINLISESLSKLDNYRENIALAKEYFNENFKFCDDPIFETISRMTKSEAENLVIDNYIEMRKTRHTHPERGFGNAHGEAIVALKAQLSEQVIDALHEAAMQVSDEDVTKYLKSISSDDESFFEKMNADDDFRHNIKEHLAASKLIDMYMNPEIIAYNPAYCDGKRKEATKAMDRLDPIINASISKYQDHQAIKHEAQEYFNDNFKELLEISPDKSCKDRIIKKYTEMRTAGFGKPEDNNGIHTNITRIFGLGRNIIGEQILAEKSELSIKVIELKAKKYIDARFDAEVERLKNGPLKEVWNQLNIPELEEKIKLSLKKEAYLSPEISQYDENYAKAESEKISNSIKEFDQFYEEAQRYFGEVTSKESIAYLASLSGRLTEEDPKFLETKNAIISNYIMMRCKGHHINIGSFYENENKEFIKQKIKDLIDLNVEKSVEESFKSEYKKIKTLYSKKWSMLSKDPDFVEFIKERIKSGIRVEAYRELRKGNYNGDYCRHKISEIGVGGVSDVSDQINLYIVLLEKLNKIKENFKVDNKAKGLVEMAYNAPIENVPIEKRFSKIREILKDSGNKQRFDDACKDLLFPKASFSSYDEKYLSRKEKKDLRLSKETETWFSKILSIPDEVQDKREYIRSWVEWLLPYSNALSAIHRFSERYGNEEVSKFIANKFIIPYMPFWTGFYNNLIVPWTQVSANFFKKDDPLFLRMIKVAAVSLSMLVTAVSLTLVAVSVVAFPLIPLMVPLAAWLIPSTGIWVRQGVNTLYEKYEINRYGYRDHIRFSVKGELKSLLENKKNGKELASIEDFGVKLGKELEYCQNRMEIVKKAIDANPESQQRDLSWIGGAASKLPTWITNFLPSSQEKSGEKILSITESLLGISETVERNRHELENLKIELNRLERTKTILNNAWDKMINKGADESDKDYEKRILEIKKDMEGYIESTHLNDYSSKIIEKGLNASGIGSPHERFSEQPEVYKGPKIVQKDEISEELTLEEIEAINFVTKGKLLHSFDAQKEIPDFNHEENSALDQEQNSEFETPKKSGKHKTSGTPSA